MAIDSLRRNSIVETLKRSDLAAMASLSATEVLLLTGYWPVLGQSLAVFSREGGSYCIFPEDRPQRSSNRRENCFRGSNCPPEMLERILMPE
jgi:hypothetical protein